jgi:hypothetical protein
MPMAPHARPEESSMSKVSVPTAFVDGTLRFLALTSQGIKRASDEITSHRSMSKRASDLRPEVLGTLLSAGLVEPHNKQAADAMLASHAETLNLLKEAALMIVELSKQPASKAASDLGAGADVKVNGAANGAEYNSLTDPYVGQRSSNKKASDRALAGEEF